MKRALKVCGLVFGGILLVTGLVVGDAWLRATRAIQAHRERLAADIAALRAKPNALDLIRSLEVPKEERSNYPSANLLSGESRTVEYDRPIFIESIVGYQKRRWDRGTDRSREGMTPTRFIAGLAFVQEGLREGGLRGYEVRRTVEDDYLQGWKRFLQESEAGASDLKEVSAKLEQLLETRPTARDVLLGHSTIERGLLFDVLETNQDHFWMLVEKPGWKLLYSRTLQVAKALNELRDLERKVLGIERRPILERETVSLEAGQEQIRSNRVTRSTLAAKATELFQSERILLTEWNLARIATAIARFQAEKGRNPEELKDLAPEYLREVPVNVYTGEPFLWKGGVLETRPGGQGPQSRWPVTR